MESKIRLCAFSDEAASDLNGQIAALRRNNILLTELRSVGGKNVSGFSPAEAKAYAAALADSGIGVWSVGSPLGKTEIKTDVKTILEQTKRVCETALLLQTDKVRMFSFFHAYGEKERVFDYLNQMADCAAGYGVTLYHENEKEIYGDTAERIREIAAAVPKLKFVYDPANFIQTGESADKTLSLVYPLAAYCHIKDVIAETGEIVPAGYGDGKIGEMIARAKGETTFTLEPHLALFDAYRQIDGSELKHKFRYPDGGAAFDAAARALKELLHKAGYQEGKGEFIKA